MAYDLNRFEIVARLTQDPELRKTTGGRDICVLSVANNPGGKDDPAEYFRVILFDKQAVFASENLKKGRRIFTAGTLKKKIWTTRDGKNGDSLEITAKELIVMDKEPERPAAARPPYDRGELPPIPEAAPPEDPYDRYRDY